MVAVPGQRTFISYVTQTKSAGSIAFAWLNNRFNFLSMAPRATRSRPCPGEPFSLAPRQKIAKASLCRHTIPAPFNPAVMPSVPTPAAVLPYFYPLSRLISPRSLRRHRCSRFCTRRAIKSFDLNAPRVVDSPVRTLIEKMQRLNLARWSYLTCLWLFSSPEFWVHSRSL